MKLHNENLERTIIYTFAAVILTVLHIIFCVIHIIYELKSTGHF